MTTRLDAELLSILSFLRQNPSVRQRLAAPMDKTVVYSGGMTDPANPSEVHRAWKLLAQAKLQDPLRFDYITLEERLKQFHIVQFGETLFEYANRVSESLKQRQLADQSMILWRALSGIYVQGAVGKVRALILPGAGIASSVFSLTEVNVLLRDDVLQKIQIDPNLLRNFRVIVKAGSLPAPIFIF